MVDGNNSRLLFKSTLVDLFIRDCFKTLRVYPALVSQWLWTLWLLFQRAALSSVGAQPLLLTCPNHIKHLHSPHFFWSCTNWDACCFSPSFFFLRIVPSCTRAPGLLLFISYLQPVASVFPSVFLRQDAVVQFKGMEQETKKRNWRAVRQSSDF